MKVFSLDSDNTMTLVGTIENTEQCYQIIPTLFGLYFAAQGGAVFFVPFDSENDANGRLGEDPTVYLIYPNEANLEDAVNTVNGTGPYVSNIAFSSNSNNVVAYRNPVTNVSGTYYQGGALFISTTEISKVDGGSCNLDTKGTRQSAVIGPSCPGTVLLSDVCSGIVSTFIDNFVDGTVYSANADLNMNLLTQNGQGGLSVFSVGYNPGSVSAGNFVENQSSTCSNGILGVIKAGLQVVAGILHLTGVFEDIKDDVLDTVEGWAGDLAACVSSSCCCCFCSLATHSILHQVHLKVFLT